MKRVPLQKASYIATMNLAQTQGALLALIQQEMSDVIPAIVARDRHQPAHLDKISIETLQLCLNGRGITGSLRGKMPLRAQ